MGGVDDLALIRRWEGFEAEPYTDVVGVWTIGYGSTKTPDGEPVTKDTPAIDEPTANEWLDSDCAYRRRRLRELAGVELNEHQAVALLSFCYNLGMGAFQSSTLRRKLRREDFGGAAGEFPRWCYAGGRKLRGLLLRRIAERDVFLTVDTGERQQNLPLVHGPPL